MITLEKINEVWRQRDRSKPVAQLATLAVRSKLAEDLMTNSLAAERLNECPTGHCYENAIIISSAALGIGLEIGYQIAMKERLEELVEIKSGTVVSGGPQDGGTSKGSN